MKKSVAHRNIWQELECWAESFKPWQKLALCHAVHFGSLGDSQIGEVYSVFLHNNGLAEDPKVTIPVEIIGRPLSAVPSPIRLARIDGLQAINALPLTAVLTFSAGLTVVYGRNGAGKSGFARILSNVCFSRARHPILPNVYETGREAGPSANITVSAGNRGETRLALAQAREDADLKRIAVFDTSVARTLLAGSNPLGFKPIGFDVFPELARIYGEIGKRLSAQIQQLTRDNTMARSFVAPESAVSQMVASLSADTDLAPIRELGKFGDAEGARLEEVQRQIRELQSKSPAEAVAQLQEAKGDVVAFEKQLSEARALLSDGNRGLYRQQLTDAAAKATNAAEQGAESFKRAFFKGIGSPEWEDFLAAARRLAQIEGDKYPHEDDHCLLCHRPLDAESAALIQRLWSFLGSPAVREAEQVRAIVGRSVKSLDGLRLTFFSPETRVRGHITRQNPALAKQIEALVETLDADRRAIADVLTAGKGEIPVAVFGDVSSELEALNARIDADIARLQEQDMAGALRSLETERVLLRHRQVLNELLPDVETFVADAGWVKKASGAPGRSLNPRPLTDKETELFQAVIAEDYKKQLQEECAALDCDLPVELSARGERGQTIRSLTIKGVGHGPNEILSEGEQRAVALADFLTEVGLNPANAGIVLDDPVTSQDHQRKERIALRLVREAETRQVIVFTHDLVFLTMLAAAAEDSGTEMLTHWVERNGAGHPGQVSLDDCPATTPQYRTTTKAKNTLRDAKAVAGSKRLELIQRGMGELRRTAEEIVPHYFLKQVVNRWSDRIIVTGLKKIDWNDGFVSEIVDTFEQLSAYIEPHSHTEERSGAPPEPKDLETMIARVDALIRRAKAEKESRRRATGQSMSPSLPELMELVPK
jgi:energy-coupling factor transporter ATP-binding protein EcfA2